MHDDGVRPKPIQVRDIMQRDYGYVLTAQAGEQFPEEFAPQLSPAQMLSLGVFGGKYLTDCADEFPDEWFANARLCPSHHDPDLNFFEVNASLPLHEWRERGWIHPDDPRGWFQWYCRYWMGRRIPAEDERQIRRWRAMTRHIAQVRKHCSPGDITCRRKQRQALMNWAYDSRAF
ncbi:MAG: hypothetical protein HGB10_01980 [Coriobacteriia bacterium]|nr:hypothetical protein [Coriobacteriia bacterium]